MYNKGDDSFRSKPARLPHNIIELIPEMLSDYLISSKDNISLCLHGGEPLLFGKDRFIEMMEFFHNTIDLSRVRFNLQTNAILIDDEWINILERFNIGVSASLDGPKHVNDISRRTKNNRSSFEKTKNGIVKLRNSPVNFAGVLCVVEPSASGRDVVDYFCDELKLDWFDFLLPDYTHDEIKSPEWEVIQDSLTEFMLGAFDAWFIRIPQGVSCRFFESIIAQSFGYKTSVDTIGQQNGVRTIVLETDGSLEPHDLSRICRDLDRKTSIFVSKGALQKLKLSYNYSKFIEIGKDINSSCLSCNVFDQCKSGHLFHRYSSNNGFKNKSVHCITLERTITHINNKLSEHILNLREVGMI